MLMQILLKKKQGMPTSSGFKVFIPLQLSTSLNYQIYKVYVDRSL